MGNSTFKKLRSWHPVPWYPVYFMVNRRGKSRSNDRFYFLGSKISADGGYSHEIKRCLLFGRKAVINLDSILKSRDITLLTKVSYGFSSSHVQI